MAEDAIATLEKFQTGQEKTSPFSTLRAVGVACLDGDKLNASIRDDLGPRRTLEFQNAVFGLARLNTLSHGRGGNSSVVNDLFKIKLLAKDLSGESGAREQAVIVVDERQEPIADRQSSYVHLARITDLKALPKGKLDTRRLIRLLEELNVVHACGCHMATAMLLRAITDHVPPVFELKSFAEVVSNYPGSKSFKGLIQNLQSSLRHVADGHLHVQMRSAEDLPTENQVDFRSSLDALLGEIIRILSSNA